MMVKRVSRRRFGVWENGVQVAEFRSERTAHLWDRLSESEQQRQRRMFSALQEAKATGLPMRGSIQQRTAHLEASKRAGRI